MAIPWLLPVLILGGGGLALALSGDDGAPSVSLEVVDEGLGNYYEEGYVYEIRWQITETEAGRYAWDITFLDAERAGYRPAENFRTPRLAKQAMLETHSGLELD